MSCLAGDAVSWPCAASGRFQLWSAVHGYVLVELAGFFHGGGDSVELFLLPLLAELTVASAPSRGTRPAALA